MLPNIFEGLRRGLHRPYKVLPMTQSNTLLRYSVGTTVPSLRVSTFDHIKVPMYSKELQMKYASTFDSLEKLLNQIKEKTNILRSLKQFLLQVLFL